MNNVSMEKFPGEILVGTLQAGNLFYLCNSKGSPMIWIVTTTPMTAVRLADGKMRTFNADDTITKIPDGAEIVLTVNGLY